MAFILLISLIEAISGLEDEAYSSTLDKGVENNLPLLSYK